MRNSKTPTQRLPFSAYELRRMSKELLRALTKSGQKDFDDDRLLAIYVVSRLCAEVEDYLDAAAPVSPEMHAEVERLVGNGLQRLASELLTEEAVKHADLAAAIRAVRLLTIGL